MAKRKNNKKAKNRKPLVIAGIIVTFFIVLVGYFVVWSNTNRTVMYCNAGFSVESEFGQIAGTTGASPEQCYVANVDLNDLPSVGPPEPKQLALIFNTEKTKSDSVQEYLSSYIEQSSKSFNYSDYSLKLLDKETIILDNGDTAILAKVYGGHPIPHESYEFVYVKGGLAITTSFPTNSTLKDEILEILKSVDRT